VRVVLIKYGQAKDLLLVPENPRERALVTAWSAGAVDMGVSCVTVAAVNGVDDGPAIVLTSEQSWHEPEATPAVEEETRS
jgi:hypothetical protein